MLFRILGEPGEHWKPEPYDWFEVVGPNPRYNMYSDDFYTGIQGPDVVVEADPVSGFTIHVLTRCNIFELEELTNALQCCSRFQPVSEDERWLYE